MTSVYLSLGSNLGERKSYLCHALAALDALPLTQVTDCSSFYETAPWGKTDQPDFLNLCCKLETDLPPQDLLLSCQKIEEDLGRVRHEHWGARTIDIDLLLYGEAAIAQDNLQIPHPYMTERAFVLLPLEEIAPYLTLEGVPLKTYISGLDVTGVKKISDQSCDKG
ncbi:2-amino-4-hydroxy-6-hydroxymethyldihydropteridine diphosphokinase [Streptococcus sp. H49]|uniref:2-amino-4-hydroxy-6- hydroxymethyldihydropteridine diphosphokinase n=1 Tax=Streptococcus huangxiaojuni TaxID=3237239 RepID=UPI0034A369C3